MKAVCTEVSPVELDEYGRVCLPAVYRSEKDVLCKRLFGTIPPGILSDSQIPNVGICKDGVTLDDITPMGGTLEEYTFTIEADDSELSPASIILYGGRFYAVGEIKTIKNPHLEIEPEVLWVLPDLESTNDVYSNLNWKVK